ncbi:GumC family protein [Fluviicola taffensis]|uniref:non-specific protein-tyrosine kinase n=1 Tax=Fluviicola taffensis (strain DSM 16823 / NCIMB 13979 / RW262) TaxID=755732 RepID=F2IKD6_FLUTR|nr:tyrosine-protein kinase [Fluviicola taffensis]AEA44039.1 capsular exopolysaccharide family [Fluviicola taffensis DSM 16823]
MNNSNTSIFINKDYNPIIAQVILRRYWWWVLLLIIFFMSVAFFYLRYTKPVYDSTTLIQLVEKDQGKQLLEIDNINKRIDISTEIELLRSQLLFDMTIARMNMNVSVFSKGKILTEEKYHQNTFTILPYSLSDSSLCDIPIWIETLENRKIRLSYSLLGRNYSKVSAINQTIKTSHFEIGFKVNNWQSLKQEDVSNDLYFTFNNQKNLAARLISNLEVNPVDANAKTIELRYTGNNPELCRDIIKSVSLTFFNYDEEMKRKGADNILAFIQIQLDSISGELKDSKDSLTDFQRKSHLTDPEGTGGSLSENMDKFQDILFDLENELTTLKVVNSKLKTEPNRLDIYRLIPEMLGKSYESSLTKQITDLNTLLERKEELLTNVTENNSELKNLNTRIQSKIQYIRRSIEVIQERIRSQVQVISGKIGEIEGEYIKLPQKKMEYNRLKSLQDLNEKYYTLLTEKKVMYSISNAGYTSSNRVLNEASLSSIPFSPNRKMVYASFIFIGFVFGIGFLFIKYITFNEINTIEDLKNLLPDKITILGNIPQLKETSEYSQLMVHSSPKSILAESMRNIRTNLSFVNPNAQVIAISSSISGEGKTFVALNLAGIISLSGKKTIVIDLDLRKPKVHLGLNVSNEAGISNLIVKQAELDSCIRKSEIDNLDFITAGPIPPNPSELILSDSFFEILEELKSRYDIVIIDNPPVGLVTDGVQILAKADIPIYIFKAHYSKRIFAGRVRELFEMNQISHLNIILNGTKNFKGKYGYGYGYGYGQGYYEEENKKKKKGRSS